VDVRHVLYLATQSGLVDVNISIPINQWTIGVVFTVIVLVWFYRNSDTQGDYDFWPAIAGMITMSILLAMWLGIVLGSVL
jgi:hypothetical protein